MSAAAAQTALAVDTAPRRDPRPAPAPLAIPNPLAPFVVAELRWYCGREYDGDLGRRSSFGHFLQCMILRVGYLPPDVWAWSDLDIRTRHAAEKLECIEGRMRRLAPWLRYTLARVFGNDRPLGVRAFWSSDLELDLGLLAGDLSARERSGVHGTVRGWLADLDAQAGTARGDRRTEARETVNHLLAAAEHLLLAAVRAYESAR